MRKNKIKILLFFGVVVITSPLTSLVSCGTNTINEKDQKKMDGITRTMIIDEMNNELSPSPSKDMDVWSPRNFTWTLNGLDGVNILINNWYTNFEAGKVTMDVRISKSSLEAPMPFTNISITGFRTINQKKLDEISKAMVQEAIDNKLSPSDFNDNDIKQPEDFFITLNELNDVSVVISDWTLNKSDDSITMTAKIAKELLISPKPFTNITIAVPHIEDRLDKLNGITITIPTPSETESFEASNSRNGELILNKILEGNPDLIDLAPDITFSGRLSKEVTFNEVHINYENNDTGVVFDVMLTDPLPVSPL